MGILTEFRSGYAKKPLNRFGIKSAKGHKTPTADNARLLKDEELFMEPYREKMLYIMYLMVGTRPDVAFSMITLEKSV